MTEADLIRADYWLYYACVDFTIHLANLTDTTYRDSNSVLFFVLWPGVTLGLWLWIGWNRHQLRALRAR